jgi:hypothetical protein
MYMSCMHRHVYDCNSFHLVGACTAAAVSGLSNNMYYTKYPAGVPFLCCFRLDMSTMPWSWLRLLRWVSWPSMLFFWLRRLRIFFWILCCQWVGKEHANTTVIHKKKNATRLDVFKSNVPHHQQQQQQPYNYLPCS